VRGISAENALKIAQRLELDEEQSEYFLLMARLDLTSDAGTQQMLRKRMAELIPGRERHEVCPEAFRAISIWYHIPILEMTTLSGFKLSAARAAKRLGIEEPQAAEAIERLLKLGLLVQTPDGSYKKAHRNLHIEHGVTHQALAQYHRQMLCKAAESIDSQPVGQRFVGSETFSIDPAQLKEAREIIERCFNQVSRLFTKGERRTDTYHLAIQLFNLTPSPRRSA
jgi:uncharacterized protein (TIGR02147 family)